MHCRHSRWIIIGICVGATLTPVVMARTTFGAGVSTVSTSPLIFFASALFALITVLLSCSRPGKIASKVSPVEATKYTETVKSKKKKRTTRGAKIHQMAFANLGRNKKENCSCSDLSFAFCGASQYLGHFYRGL